MMLGLDDVSSMSLEAVVNAGPVQHQVGKVQHHAEDLSTLCLELNLVHVWICVCGFWGG